MGQDTNDKLLEHLEQFYQEHYHDQIENLAKNYPEQRSIYLDINLINQLNSDLADDCVTAPEAILEYFEEALRLYDHSSDTKLGNARVRLKNLSQQTSTNDLRAQDIEIGGLVEMQGVVHRATDVQQAITDCAFECQLCGTRTYIPIQGDEIQKPRECQGCERKGHHSILKDQSELVDRQKMWLLESRQNLPQGDSPDIIEVHIEDDIAGTVAAGDAVTVVGVVRVEQSKSSGQGSNLFEPYLDALSVFSHDPGTSQFSLASVKAPLDIKTYAEVAPAILSGLPDETREEETKAKLIMPFIEALGWNKFDNTELRMEYSDSMTDRRPDYALFGEDSQDPDVVIEAKQIGESLEEHTNQICDYIRLYSAKWGILTNGERFYAYRLGSEQNRPRKLAELTYADLPSASIVDSISRSSFYSE